MNKFFVLILLITSGCSSLVRSGPATINFNSSVDGLLEPQITDFILELNSNLNKDAFRFGRTISGRKIIISYTDKQNGRIAGFARSSAPYCEVTIYPTAIKSDILKTTVWHELGHCVGLHHNGVSGEIMSEIALPFKVYKEDKIDRFLKDFNKAVEDL
jgi:hypothetical protein